MENLKLNNLNIIELNEKELILVEGGTSLWYDVAYAVGAFVGACVYMGECTQGNPHI